MLTFLIHRSNKDSQWYVRITSGNNEPWFTSEGYETKDNAVRSAEDFFTAMTPGSGYIRQGRCFLGGSFVAEIKVEE